MISRNLKHPHDVSFRSASPADAHRLTGLALRAKAHWGYPNDWMNEWRQELTINPDYIQANSVVLAEQNSQLIGFFGLEFHRPGSAWLQHLWVEPALIGRGFGRDLFECACETARTRGAESLEFVADPNAEPFYLHLGATRVGLEQSSILGIPRLLPRMLYRLEVKATSGPAIRVFQ